MRRARCPASLRARATPCAPASRPRWPCPSRPRPRPRPPPALGLASRLPFTLATFVVGALTGAVAHRALAPRPAPTVIVRTVTAAPPPVAPPPVAPAPAVVPAIVDASVVDASVAVEDASAEAVAADVPTRAHGPRARDEGSLNAERAVLEIARTALTRGQSSAAIDALERHARRFPRGRMAPERESMWVQALVSAGRYDAAREHAARFRRSYPGSMLQPVVDAALREIP
ncbi:MAG: hypothetical protein R3A52_27190 [Polyangiales bacterium]